jgi:hypothetical protein
MRPSTEAAAELSLQQRIDLALDATLEKLLADHRRTGTPLTILHDGQVVRIPVEEFDSWAREFSHSRNGTPVRS